MLNRAVLIVRPGLLFIEWAKSLDDSEIAPSPQDEQTIYLIPQYDNDNESARVLKMVFAEVFERELEAWHLDQKKWPKKRTFQMFKEWFVIEMHSMVEDLCADGLFDDEL